MRQQLEQAAGILRLLRLQSPQPNCGAELQQYSKLTVPPQGPQHSQREGGNSACPQLSQTKACT